MNAQETKPFISSKKLRKTSYNADIGAAVEFGFDQYQNRLQLVQSYTPKGGSWTSMNLGIDHEQYAVISGRMHELCERIRTCKDISEVVDKDKTIVEVSYRDRTSKEYVKTGSVIIGYDTNGIYMVVRSNKKADFPVTTHYFTPHAKLTTVFQAKDETLSKLKLSAYVAYSFITKYDEAVIELLKNPVPVAPPNGGGYTNKQAGGNNSNAAPITDSDIDW